MLGWWGERAATGMNLKHGCRVVFGDREERGIAIFTGWVMSDGAARGAIEQSVEEIALP